MLGYNYKNYKCIVHNHSAILFRDLCAVRHLEAEAQMNDPINAAFDQTYLQLRDAAMLHNLKDRIIVFSAECACLICHLVKQWN
jgi:hypothetical protein